jgi:hypothetical protein
VDAAQQLRASVSLSIHDLSARLRSELEKRDKLLQRIAKKREKLRVCVEEARDAHAAAPSRLEPLIRECGELMAGMASMLDALARDPKRSRRQRQILESIRGDLLGDDPFAMFATDFDAAAPLDQEHEPAPAKGAGPSWVPPADARPAGASHDALRVLFRRLADALHPDKVQDESERAVRTEAMKRVTAAYQAGDYAALLEIQKSICGTATSQGSDDQARYDVLLRENAALRRQERALDKDLRIARAGGRAELERAIEHAEQMLAELRRMHDFVRAFRDGKIDWKTFVAGPPTELGGDDIDDLLDDLDIAAALDVLLGSAPRRRRSRR